MKHLIAQYVMTSTLAVAAIAALAADVEEIDLSAGDDSAEAAEAPKIEKTEDGYIDVSFENATVASVLQQFRRATRMNILSGDSTNLQRRVSASLSHVQWTDAMRSILGLADFKVDLRNGIWFVSEKTAEEVHHMTRYYVLKHASAVDLADLFNGIAMKTSYADRSSIRAASAQTTGLLSGIAKGSADAVAEGAKGDEKHSALAGRCKATAFPNTNTLVLTGPEAKLIECENIINELDRAITQVYIEARFIELSSEALHKLGIQWNQLESWGATVKGATAGWERNDGDAANYGLFQTQKSVNNNSTVSKTASDTASASGSDSSASVNNSVSKNTTASDNGTYTGLAPNSIGEAVRAGASAASMGWSQVSTFSGQLSADDFRLAISAFEQLEEGKLFSNPRIIVANGKEAKVDMTTKEPNVEVRSSRTGVEGQSLDISTKLETIPGNDRNLFAGEAFFSYGITLSVKPRVSPTGLISVEVVPTISEKHGDKKVSGDGTSGAVYTTYPLINIKSINTEFTMKDGATAVIGGLTRTEETDVDSGIPYLRKIPWIGQKIFGWQSRKKVQTEILVCVTVGIANPETLRRDAGLPTNAVLGREYVEGRRLEPGQRPNAAENIYKVDTRTLDQIHEDPYLAKDDENAFGDDKSVGDEAAEAEVDLSASETKAEQTSETVSEKKAEPEEPVRRRVRRH